MKLIESKPLTINELFEISDQMEFDEERFDLQLFKNWLNCVKEIYKDIDLKTLECKLRETLNDEFVIALITYTLPEDISLANTILSKFNINPETQLKIIEIIKEVKK
jgi:hypothetical protein